MNLAELKGHMDTGIKRKLAENPALAEEVFAMSLTQRYNYEVELESTYVKPLAEEVVGYIGTRDVADLIVLDGAYWLLNEYVTHLPNDTPKDLIVRALIGSLSQYGMGMFRYYVGQRHYYPETKHF